MCLYSAGGVFEVHRDLQALTLLLPLVGADAFEGGGTAFWPPDSPAVTDRAPEWGGLGTVPSGVVDAAPVTVLTPPAGSALLFSGEAAHAGQVVTGGCRAVFVASFSLRAAGGAVSGRGSSTVPDSIDDEELRRLERTMLQQMYQE